MINRVASAIFVICLSVHAMSQHNDSSFGNTAATTPEEIVIVGERSLLQLRMQMVNAEKVAYDTFNQFNDERRFEISCSMQQPTGTRFSNQICLPNFKQDATAAHGQALLQDYRNLYLQNECILCPAITGSAVPAHIPSASEIAAQQKQYMLKMETLAREHPEFLEALIRYSETKTQYEEAIRTIE
jgi:hypothetical protein